MALPVSATTTLEELVAAGQSPEEARRRAFAEFGAVAAIKDNGTYASFSTPGAALLVAAPGSASAACSPPADISQALRLASTV